MSERTRQRRITLVALPLALIVSVALVGLTTAVVVLAQRNSGYRVALDAQRDQARRSGQTPVARAPGQIDQDPDRPLATPTPGPRGERGQQGERGPGPTDEQVSAAVASYFHHHNAVEPATIAAYVANYLHKHPPTRGPGPTPEQVSSAVMSYLTDHPPSPGPAGSPGTTGDQGPRGPGPTPEQVAKAVADYLRAHPVPVCPDGTEAQAHQVVVDDDGNPLTSDTVDAVVCVKT